MKFSKVVVLLASVLAVSTSSAAVTAFSVNGISISKADQEEVLASLEKSGTKRNAALEEFVRGQFVRQAVIESAAKNAKIDKRPDVSKAVKNTTRAIISQAFVEDYIKNHPIKDADIKAAFDREKKNWGDREVHVRHIVVKDKATADDLMNQIRKGADFAKLAEANSIDSPENKKAGGLIDWTSPRVFDRDFAAGINNLAPGELCRQPIQSRLGWHIIKLEGERPAQQWQKFEDYEKMIRQRLHQEAFAQYVQQLANKAKIINLK